ncbi:MAG: D-sedoheptulose 7-phosphate isomerase [Leptospiraceae bacterium]|nr:D-sedoheptulose 7-phosphate isomerase [Leptospiraceae bacterium]
MLDFIKKQIQDSYEVKQAILNDVNLVQLIEKACSLSVSAYRKGNKVLAAGNGGSAADAQHIVAEFVSRFYFDRPALPAIALTTDTSILTAIGNDYGYERLFARQLEANGVKDDIYIAISTSGNSPNILNSLQTCKDKGIISIGLTGLSGGKMKELCDICICVPSSETPRIQESHILIGHIICASVEQAMFGKSKPI